MQAARTGCSKTHRRPHWILLRLHVRLLLWLCCRRRVRRHAIWLAPPAGHLRCQQLPCAGAFAQSCSASSASSGHARLLAEVTRCTGAPLATAHAAGAACSLQHEACPCPCTEQGMHAPLGASNASPGTKGAPRQTLRTLHARPLRPAALLRCCPPRPDGNLAMPGPAPWRPALRQTWWPRPAPQCSAPPAPWPARAGRSAAASCAAAVLYTAGAFLPDHPQCTSTSSYSTPASAKT